MGIGPDSAVTLLFNKGDDPERLSTETSFAASCGVSPVEYSSGRRSPRRLHHGGHRQANAAAHRMVFTRLRHDPRPPGVLRTPHPGGQDSARNHPMVRTVRRPRGLQPGQ
ncbi:transposase [Streptomyces pharetrae]|uniref:transposase n=1 Tax=Streptomyces pharetrae TaxID=291370 RepID=UPI00296F0FEA